MKTFILLAASIFAFTLSGFSQGSENIIKNKAYAIQQMNNQHQAAIAGGSTAPASPGAPTPAAAAPTLPTGPALPTISPDQMKTINQMSTDFTALKAGTGSTSNIVNDLTSLSKVGLKPTKDMLTKLVQNLNTALSEKSLDPTQMKTLGAYLSGLMNSSNLPAPVASSLASKTGTLLQSAGISATSSTGVTRSMSDIITYMQKGKSSLYN